MKINRKIQDAINKQINHEFYSAYLYLSMSAYFESINLKGFAHWMRTQAKEEDEHAMKLYKFLVERGGKVILSEIEKPPLEWKSPLDAIESAYKHEQKVTEMINGLVNLAAAEKDRATEVFLQWFVNEQVEEENSTNELVQKLKLVGDSGNGLLMIDSELAKRKE